MKVSFLRKKNVGLSEFFYILAYYYIKVNENVYHAHKNY